MNDLTTLTLFLSWKCNFACDHCGFLCGPDRTEKMDILSAKRCIEEASVNKSLEMVAYSGGEPFLYYQQMKELMQFSYDRGFRAGLVTNCYWAKSYDIAYKYLSELRELGLDEIITSVDDYHLKYVDVSLIKNAIEAALDIGIMVGINILFTLDSKVRQNNLHELLHIPKEIIENSKLIWTKESSPIRAGRAKELFKDDMLKDYGYNELLNNPCEYVIKNSVVSPKGSVYACCGFGGAGDGGPSEMFYGGNIEETSMNEIHNRFKRNLLLNIISVRGPYILLLMVKERYPEVEFRERYVSNCDVCEELFSNIPLKNALGKLIDELSKKLIRMSS
ncbi:radical SAM protein [Tissierella creatinini]|nr:radical SAM protein [Tissierella creatinini]TJX60374.1 radical SAM protein [Soehngenia saccharolytica]